MTIEKAREDLVKLQRKKAAYYHAMGLISYDGDTTAPKDTAANRAASLTVLSEELYMLSTGKETVELLEYLDQNKDQLPFEERYLRLYDVGNQKACEEHSHKEHRTPDRGIIKVHAFVCTHIYSSKKRKKLTDTLIIHYCVIN